MHLVEQEAVTARELEEGTVAEIMRCDEDYDQIGRIVIKIKRTVYLLENGCPFEPRMLDELEVRPLRTGDLLKI